MAKLNGFVLRCGKMVEEQTINVITGLIKSSFGIQTERVILDDETIQRVCSIANRQSISYIILTGIERQGYASLLSDNVKRQRSKLVYDFVQRREALKTISDCLDGEGISYVPLKGAALWDLYPVPYMRSCSDIDVLVKENDCKKAITAIESKTDFKYLRSTYHDAHLINKRVHLELHFSLLSNIVSMDKVLSEAWNNVRECDETGKLCFSPEYHIFYIVSHAAKHFAKGGGIGVRPLLDIWILRSKTAFDERIVEKYCREAGIIIFYNTCCALLSVWFDKGEHTDLSRRFEEYIFSGGVFGSERTKALLHRQNGAGVRYLCSRVLVPNDSIKAMFPICEKHALLIPACHVARWFSIANPRKRKIVRAELNSLRNIDTNELEEYHRFRRDLGF